MSTSLFSRLCPSRPTTVGATGQPPCFGREDYITEAVAAVLQADQEAGGTLTATVLEKLFGIELHGTPTIETQKAYDAAGSLVSHPDLVVHTDQDLVFIENKTGSALGIYTCEGSTLTQLDKYQRELDAQPRPYCHLAMLVWSPPVGHDGTWAFWWDLHTAIQRASTSGDPYADGLRAELLAFFRELQLDPPKAIPAEPAPDRTVVHRVLAMALAEPGLPVDHVRPSSLAAMNFDLTEEDGTVRVAQLGFVGGAPYAYVTQRGYRRIDLGEGFFERTTREQVTTLAQAVRALPEADADPRDAQLLDRDAFLASLGDLSEAVRALLDAAPSRGWTPSYGRTEVVVAHPSCGPRLYLSTKYTSGPTVRIGCGPGDTQVVRELLSHHDLATHAEVSGESVKVPMDALGGRMVELLDLLRALPR